ncbi:hypothetical protein [Pseudomonas defluvii]|uniref:hypothetical protein n=1 Tax=Pseudomonas defluvii TaxID=1876757 RepID=UPI0039068C5D
MKRNIEAVLKVLTAVEEDTHVEGMSGYNLSLFCVEECSTDDLESAMTLLVDSGYLVGKNEGSFRLSWAGHSLLEELRGQ